MRDQIVGAITAVTKPWSKQRKQEERDARARRRRREALIRARRVTRKEAAYSVMESSYMKASSENRYPAQARQIMYAARPRIQEMTGQQLTDTYFTKNLLPNYLLDHAEATETWDVVFDARGHLYEPHTGRVLALGTIDVRQYLGDLSGRRPSRDTHLVRGLFPTRGPVNRFQAILFLEKEGFFPLFEAVKLAERFDIAIMSTKGLSSTASRLLVDRLCGSDGIPLFILHDFDKAGFSIVGTLTRSNWRYRFQNEINAIDLGLRLADVEAHDLWDAAEKWEAPDTEAKRAKARTNLKRNGATSDEIDFLLGEGKRVELNAFSSGALVAWIETNLHAHGVEKVVPKNEVLVEAARRAARSSFISDRMADLEAAAGAFADKMKLPRGLESRVRRFLKENPDQPWDAGIERIVEDLLDEEAK